MKEELALFEGHKEDHLSRNLMQNYEADKIVNLAAKADTQHEQNPYNKILASMNKKSQLARIYEGGDSSDGLDDSAESYQDVKHDLMKK